MIEKSPDVKLYEQADSLIDGFRDSVREAQKHAHDSGVDYTFVANGIRYVARPNGDIEKQSSKSGE
jgi:hypothetical protein